MTTYTDDHPCRDNIPDASGAGNCGANQIWDEALQRCRQRCSQNQVWNEESQTCRPLQPAGNGETNPGSDPQGGIVQATAPRILVSSNEINAKTIEESLGTTLGENV